MQEDVKTEIALLKRDLLNHEKNMARIEKASSDGLRQAHQELTSLIKEVRDSSSTSVKELEAKMDKKFTENEKKLDKMSETLAEISQTLATFKGSITTTKAFWAVAVPIGGFIGWLVNHFLK